MRTQPRYSRAAFTKAQDAAIALKSYRRIAADTTKSHSDQQPTNRSKTMKPIKPIIVILILTAVTLVATSTVSADDLVRQSRHALQQLVAQNPAAATCKSKAVAVLVFPDVVKAGFIFGAQGGKGILFVRG